MLHDVSITIDSANLAEKMTLQKGSFSSTLKKPLAINRFGTHACAGRSGMELAKASSKPVAHHFTYWYWSAMSPPGLDNEAVRSIEKRRRECYAA